MGGGSSKKYGNDDSWGYPLMKNTNFDPNKLYKIQDGKKNGFLTFEGGRMISKDTQNIFSTNFGFNFQKNPDGTFYIKHQGKYLATTKTLVPGDNDSYLIVLRDKPDERYSKFKFNVENGEYGVFTIEAYSMLDNKWYYTSVWRGRSNAPFAISQGYTHDKSHKKDNFQYNISEAALSPLPYGLKENVDYGIYHPKLNLYLASIAGPSKDSPVGIFTDELSILWDPNSYFKLEYAGNYKGHHVMRIKTHDGKYYVTANGPNKKTSDFINKIFGIKDSSTELALREKMSIDEMNKKSDYSQFFAINKVGDKYTLGSFWSDVVVNPVVDPITGMTTYDTYTVVYGPDAVTPLDYQKKQTSYPAVLTQKASMDKNADWNGFQFKEVSSIAKSDIKVRTEKFVSLPHPGDKNFICCLILFIIALILLILVIYFICKK